MPNIEKMIETVGKSILMAENGPEMRKAIKRSLLLGHGYKVFLDTFIEDMKKKPGTQWAVASIEKVLRDIEDSVEKELDKKV